MHKKLKAVEVIPDKMWITYDADGNKTGTMRPATDDDSCLVQYITDGSKVAHDRDDIDQIFEFVEKPEPSSWHDRHVLGYPVPKIETFQTQERDNLPCFTKTPNSSVFFAAGHYGINFDNGGWLDSFCPKLATLRKYEYIGPFKTATDMTIAIQRKKHRNE